MFSIVVMMHNLSFCPTGETRSQDWHVSSVFQVWMICIHGFDAVGVLVLLLWFLCLGSVPALGICSVKLVMTLDIDSFSGDLFMLVLGIWGCGHDISCSF